MVYGKERTRQKLFLRQDNNRLVSRDEYVVYLRRCSADWRCRGEIDQANHVAERADIIERNGAA